MTINWTLDEMDKFLEKSQLTKIDTRLNYFITLYLSKKLHLLLKKYLSPSHQKYQDQLGLQVNSIKHFRKNSFRK